MKPHAFVALVLAATSFAAVAQESAAGAWRTIDDNTGKARSIIRITEANGVLSGKIEKLIREAGDDPNPKCTACTDSRKDQPMQGMTIMTGLKREGDTPVWSGGEILDPSSGKLYKTKATLVDGGKKLEVRGYIGVPMLGRTQTWLREP